MCWLLARLNHRDGAVAMWKKNTMRPFKAANPFSLHLKSPLSTLSLPLHSLSRLISSAKISRACFLSWEDGNQTEGRQGDRNEGGKTDWGAVRVEFSLTEAGLIASLWFCCSEVGGREDERKKCPLVLASCVTSQGSSVQSKSCDLLTGNVHKTQKT